jgi:hypothetical protein
VPLKIKRIPLFCDQTDFSSSAEIVVVPDSDGLLTIPTDNESGIVPGKLQFLTRNDDGKIFPKGEFDKGGRFFTYFEHWSVTSAPVGSPIVCVANNDYNSKGASLSLKRSRGTFENPSSVKDNDNVFKISWEAHDGISYREVASISTDIKENSSAYKLSSEITLTTTNKHGKIVPAIKITDDQTLKVNHIDSLTENGVEFKSPVKLPKYQNEKERDCLITNPELGMMIFLISSDSIQIFTDKSGWVDL